MSTFQVGLMALCLMSVTGCAPVVEGNVVPWTNGVDNDQVVESPSGENGGDEAGDGGTPLGCEVDDDADGFVSTQCGGDDCEDNDATMYPGAPDQTCDGKDNDCANNGDGVDLFRDGESACGGIDADDDDYMDIGEGEDGVPFIVDCDDSDAAIHPGATEICDGLDNDCDGLVDSDDGSLDPTTVATYFADSDGDGFGDIDDLGTVSCEPAGVLNHTDCDDSAAGTNPDAEEIPYNGIDEDCSGEDITDVDCDGMEAESVGGPDCDDDEFFVNPLADEICNGGVDDDCDGLVDDADPSVDLDSAPGFLPDADGDGFGDQFAGLTEFCTAPAGFVLPMTGGVPSSDDDCNDADAAIHPGAPDPVGGADADCSEI